MNTLDMQTREKVNRIHLDEMQRDAMSRHLLRTADHVSKLGNAAAKKRLLYTLAFAALVILIGACLAVILM